MGKKDWEKLGKAGSKKSVEKRLAKARETASMRAEKTQSAKVRMVRSEWKKSLRYKVRVVLLVFFWFLMIMTVVVWSEIVRADEYQAQQEGYLAEVVADLEKYYDDYNQEVPKLEFEMEGLEAIKAKNELVRGKKYRERKAEIEERIARLKEFAEIRAKVEEFFRGEGSQADVAAEEIEALRVELGKLKESYRRVLQPKFEMIQDQYQEMVELAVVVPELFVDEKMEKVKDDLTRERYDEIKIRVDSLPQREVAEKYAEALKKVDEVLAERERIAEEARRKAAEEYRRRQAEIAAAWVALGVPYWSQNGEGVKNGCEAASLLMALQYKGYLGGMDLRTYAEMMPKSDDPFAGFRGNIFESAGSDAPFWIAPGPLAAFGRESSGNPNVVDVTGASLDALDAEVAAGNPVVIYLTLGYTTPSAWQYGAPANLHVMLLTGYNSMTGVQRLTDPLTVGGRRYYDLPRAQVEAIFNSTGNRAVVVK